MKKFLLILSCFLFIFVIATPNIVQADFCPTDDPNSATMMEYKETGRCISFWEKVVYTLGFGLTGLILTNIWNSCFCTVPTFLRAIRYFSGGDQFCWFCKLVAVVYNEGIRIATKFVYELQDFFLDLLGIGILFFIVFKVGKMFASFKETGPAAFATEILKPLLRAIFAFIILLNITSLFYWIVNPFLDLTQGLTNTVLDEEFASGVPDLVKKTAEVKIISVEKKKIKALDLDVCEESEDPNEQKKRMNRLLTEQVNTKLDDKVKISDGQDKDPLLGAKFRDGMLIRPLCRASSYLVTGLAMGSTFMSFGLVDIWNSWTLLIVGIIIFFAYFMIMLTFPLKMVDALMQLIFVVLLSPFFIILWVFPATVGYTKKGWDMFLSSCLTLFLLSFMMILALNLVGFTIAGNEKVFDALVVGDVEGATPYIQLSSGDVLITFGFGFIAAKLIGMASSLSKSMVGGGVGSEISSAIQKNAMKIGTSVGKLASKPVGAVATVALTATTGGTSAILKGGANALKSVVTAGIKKIGQKFKK